MPTFFPNGFLLHPAQNSVPLAAIFIYNEWMAETLLRTKLFAPPVRPNRVARPHLIQNLNQSLASGHKLALVCAPAGFGKTTLVRAWAEQCPHALAWLSLDADDNDLMRFLTYLVAAVQTVSPETGRGALAALQSTENVASDTILTLLLNDMVDQQTTFCLVLDDYHVIETPAIDEAIDFLLEHQPPQMHLAIATRHDPTLPLARLRVRGELTDLRAADLRFSNVEAAEFLNQVMGLDLSAENIAALEARTEGWIAGLQLAAISLQRREKADDFITSFTGSNRFVLDYLVEEVLDQQTPENHEFLLQTSILERFNGSLCDAVRSEQSGSENARFINGQQILEQFDHDNLFIVPLDEERRWYRYHHLFADLLRRRLRQSRHEVIPVLHGRASDWFTANGYVNEAIEHALRADALEWAADLLVQSADSLWQRGEHGHLRRWMNALPPEMVFARPHIGLFHAWYLFASGQQDSAEAALQAVESALAGADNPDAEPSNSHTQQILLGRVATVRAFMASFRGDVPAIIRHATDALALLPEDDLTWRSSAAITLGDAHGFIGDMQAAYDARLAAAKACAAADDTYFILIANLKLAITLRAQGRLEETIEICRRQLRFTQSRGLSRMPAAGWCLAIWAEVLAERNELERALEQVEHAIELTERGLDLAMIGWSRLCQVRVLYSAGRLTDAAATIRKTIHQTLTTDMPPWIVGAMEMWQARLWLDEGKVDEAAAWAAELSLHPGDSNNPPPQLTFFRLRDHIMLARILLAQRDTSSASTLLEWLWQEAKSSGRIASSVEIALLQSLTHHAAGGREQALAALERALTVAEPCGFVCMFVDEGSLVADLLRLAQSRGITSAYSSRLLAAFSGAEQGALPSTTPQTGNDRPKPDLIEPLSERELEVLQLIAVGLTNREIGERLYLTLNTVKVHTRNIYGKLGVHSRTQAVAVANELGLLPAV